MEISPRSEESCQGLVSITICSYRGEEFIAGALESISKQTYRHWELIVVEDGSADGTEALVSEFASRHPENRVDFSRSEKNQGLGATRNLTFARSRGEFVAILDADDYWLPTHLERAVAGLIESGRDVSFSTSIMFEDGTGTILGVWGPEAEDLQQFPQSLFGRNYITPSAAVIRREVLTRVGPWDTFEYGEDFSYWMRSIAAGVRFQFIKGCHCYYRKNHHGAMTSRQCNMLEGVAQVSERFAQEPNIDPKLGRKYVAKLYELAARMHFVTGWRHDPSANPKRAPRLLLKAWSYQPHRVSYLGRAVKLAIKARIPSRKRWKPTSDQRAA